jgi:hypothetical protein
MAIGPPHRGEAGFETLLYEWIYSFNINDHTFTPRSKMEINYKRKSVRQISPNPNHNKTSTYRQLRSSTSHHPSDINAKKNRLHKSARLNAQRNQNANRDKMTHRQWTEKKER